MALAREKYLPNRNRRSVFVSTYIIFFSVHLCGEQEREREIKRETETEPHAPHARSLVITTGVCCLFRKLSHGGVCFYNSWYYYCYYTERERQTGASPHIYILRIIQ